METKTPSFVSGKIILALVYLFVFIRVLSHFEIVEESPFINGVSYGLTISLIVYYLQDIIVNNVYNKAFWVVSIVVLSIFSAPFYLYQRDKLISLGRKLKRGKYFNKE